MPYGNMASETLFQQRWNGAKERGARIIVTENRCWWVLLFGSVCPGIGRYGGMVGQTD